LGQEAHLLGEDDELAGARDHVGILSGFRSGGIRRSAPGRPDVRECDPGAFPGGGGGGWAISCRPDNAAAASCRSYRLRGLIVTPYAGRRSPVSDCNTATAFM
jgi:hypothetical protein